MFIKFVLFFCFFLYLTSNGFSEEEIETFTLPEIEIQSSIGDRTRLVPGSTNFVDRSSMIKHVP